MSQSIVGQRVKIYRNLNNGMIAVRDIKTNKVITYCQNIHLINCETKTSPTTAARIRRILEEAGKQARDVHAFIIGTVVCFDSHSLSAHGKGRKVSYNPFKGDNFYYCDDMTCFTSCDEVKAFAAPKGQPMTTIAIHK